MTRSTALAIAALGGLMLLAALIIGLSPVKAGGVSCGNAFHTSNDAAVSDLTSSFSGGLTTDTAASCDDKLSGRRTLTYALGGVGLAAGVLGLVTTPSKPTDDHPTEATRSP